jgi:hypothetical protein
MPSAVFETTIPATKLPQTYALQTARLPGSAGEVVHTAVLRVQRLAHRVYCSNIDRREVAAQFHASSRHYYTFQNNCQ